MITQAESPAYLGGRRDVYPLAGLALARPARVLEVGAGSGDGTLQLAERFADTSITCLEPGDAARAALAWRVADHGLRERVSVLPLEVADTAALGQFDLVVCHHVVCEVPLSDRGRFWRAVRERLLPTGTVLVDDHFGPTTSDSVPRRLSAQGTFGAYRYERWFAADRIDGRSRTVSNEYLILDADGRVVHSGTRHDVVDVVDPDEQLALIAGSGLRAEAHADGWLALRLAAPPAGGHVDQTFGNPGEGGTSHLC